jgi:hypothetical protein
MAACVADHMNPNDLFLAAEWDWSTIHYIHSSEMVSFIEKFHRIAQQGYRHAEDQLIVHERQRQGAHVHDGYHVYQPNTYDG